MPGPPFLRCRAREVVLRAAPVFMTSIMPAVLTGLLVLRDFPAAAVGTFPALPFGEPLVVRPVLCGGFWSATVICHSYQLIVNGI